MCRGVDTDTHARERYGHTHRRGVDTLTHRRGLDTHLHIHTQREEVWTHTHTSVADTYTQYTETIDWLYIQSLTETSFMSTIEMLINNYPKI